MKAMLCSTKFYGLILLAVYGWRGRRLILDFRYLNLEATQTSTYLLSKMKRKISEEHDSNTKLSRPRLS